MDGESGALLMFQEIRVQQRRRLEEEDQHQGIAAGIRYPQCRTGQRYERQVAGIWQTRHQKEVGQTKIDLGGESSPR